VRDELIEIVRRRAIPSPADSLVTWCARPSMPDALVPELRRRAGLVADWDTVLDLAEVHGLGPLLGTHLKAWVPDIPPKVSRQLTALLLWNRRANAVLFRVLADVVAALRAFHGLPFAAHQLPQFPPERVAAALAALAASGRLRSYRPLVDAGGAAIAQAEHTLYVHEDRIEVLTL